MTPLVAAPHPSLLIGTPATPSRRGLSRPSRIAEAGASLSTETYEHLRTCLNRSESTSTLGNYPYSSLQRAISPRRALHELRRLSGLTWNQLAELFGVSRRAVHFWASGQSLTEKHQKQLFELLKLIGDIDRGSARANRSALLNAVDDSVSTPFEQMIKGDYRGVKHSLGLSTHKRPVSYSPTPEQIAAKQPASPFGPDGGLDDTRLPTSGIYRASKRLSRQHGLIG
jgi:DNA-binding transcriptional regulator YiaG